MTEPTTRTTSRARQRIPLVALAGFAAITAAVGALAWWTGRDVTPGLVPPYADGPAWLDALFRGDSGWYYSIASVGYGYTPGEQSSIAFFPAYPTAVHLLGELMGGDFSTAAGLITMACAAGAVWLFASWVRTRLPGRPALVAVGLLLLYPYSFFLYGTGYSDALFLVTALGSFALLERRCYLLAGLVGILATAGRPIGIAVTVGLAVRAMELLAERRAARSIVTAAEPEGTATEYDRGAGRPVPLRALVVALRDVRLREVSLLVSVVGLVAWMVYLGQEFGDPLAFAAVQAAPGWNQGSGPFTWFKGPFVGSVLSLHWDVLVLIVPQAIMCGLAVLLVRTCWRRFGWGYTAFAVVSIAIPIVGTKDFMGSGRYVLAAFPLLAAAAVVLTGDRRPRWLAPVVLGVLGVGLVIATIAYVHGVGVS